MPRTVALALAALLVVGVCARAAHAEESGLWEAETRAGFGDYVRQSVNDVFTGHRVYWDRGPVMETTNKALALHIGYEGQFDAVWYGEMDEEVEDASGQKWISGFDTRRSRVGLEVFFLKNWYLRVRYGWGSFEINSFQDLFLEFSGLTHVPGDWWPVLRIGQVKEPMTIDWMNNALRTTFAERAMFTSTIIPNRNLGIRAQGMGPGGRVAYQVGSYLVNIAELSSESEYDGQAVTGRLTALPWAPKDRPNHLLHIGVAASWRWNFSSFQAQAKPESWVGPPILDTGEVPASGASVLVGEMFYQRDRLSFTAEGAWTRVEHPGGDVSHFWGGYGQVSYFLTPGHLRYHRVLGCYGRVKPKRTIFCRAKDGFGDFEVAARYSILDMTDSPYPGGMAWSVTLGLNWYARDNIRFYFNYVHSNIRDAYGVPDADGTLNTLLVRVAYDL